MQVNKVDNQNFCAIKPKSKRVEGILFERLNSVKRHTRYDSLVRLQENNPVDIILDAKRKRFEATIVGSNNEEIKKKEGIISYVLKLNPNKFFEDMCKLADNLNPNKSI